MKAYQMEFPDYPVEDMPELGADWKDASYHSDACPCFINHKLGAALFVDYLDKEKRALGELKRFVAFDFNERAGVMSNCPPIAESEDLVVVLAAVAKAKIAPPSPSSSEA